MKLEFRVVRISQARAQDVEKGHSDVDQCSEHLVTASVNVADALLQVIVALDCRIRACSSGFMRASSQLASPLPVLPSAAARAITAALRPPPWCRLRTRSPPEVRWGAASPSSPLSGFPSLSTAAVPGGVGEPPPRLRRRQLSSPLFL